MLGKEKIRNSKTEKSTSWTGSHGKVPRRSWGFWKRWGNKLVRRLSKRKYDASNLEG